MDTPTTPSQEETTMATMTPTPMCPMGCAGLIFHVWATAQRTGA